METIPYGHSKDGRTVRLFTLRNANGIEVQLCEHGALIASVKTPDRDGQFANITLGKDSFAAWLDNPEYLGVTVGRYGNRIADGKFLLDGKEYQLATNNDPGGLPCHLHGGLKGYDQALWSGQPVIRPNASGVCFTYYSDDGEEGYPGNLAAKVTYWLTGDNELIFEATATTDAPTPVNLINHTYWNLSGDPSRTILEHELEIKAREYLPTNVGLIPTGRRSSVADTPMDFRRPSPIGKRIADDFEALKLGLGYDHCWCLSDYDGESLHPAALLHDPASGRLLELATNQPGLQFYTGNYLSQKHTGLCLETQAFPDSPNQADFPNCILRPGETYRHIAAFRFSTR